MKFLNKMLMTVFRYNIAEVHQFARNSVMEFQNICNEMVAPFLLHHPVVFIGEENIVIDYLYAKFGDFGLIRFSFIMRTDRHTESQRRMIAILTRLSSVSVITLF